MSCSSLSPCKLCASTGCFDKELHRSSTCCKKNHLLCLVINPDAISFISCSLGHLLKILGTADPCQAVSDRLLSLIYQNLGTPRACCPYRVDNCLLVFESIMFPFMQCYFILREVHTKAIFSLEELVARKWREVVFCRRKPVLQNWHTSARQVSQGHPEASGQEHMHNDCPTH